MRYVFQKHFWLKRLFIISYVAGARSSNTFLGLGWLLLCKAFSQVPVSNQPIITFVSESWLQADGRPQNEEEYTMGESSGEDQRISARLKNI